MALLNVNSPEYKAQIEAWKQANWNNGGTTATTTTAAENLANAAAPKTPMPNAGYSNPTDILYANNGPATPAPIDAPQKSTGTPPIMPPQTQQSQAVTTPAVQQQQTPMPQTDYGQLTRDQIAAEAAARIAKQRAAITGAVNQTKTSLKNTYDRANQVTADNRALENARLDRTLNPFSGRTSYDKAMVGRERSLADESFNKEYQANNAAADQKLLDFETLAPEQQDAIMNELTRMEREYGISVGQLTGQFQGSPTLAARTAQQQYDLGLAGLSGQLPGGGQTLAAQNQQYQQYADSRNYDYQAAQDEINNRFKDKQFNTQLAQWATETFGTAVDPKQDVGVFFEQFAGLPTMNAQKLAIDVQQQGFENGIKKALAENTINTDQAKLVLDRAQTAISQQNANTSSANAANSASNSANQQKQYEQDRIDSQIKQLNDLYTYKDPDTGQIAVSNPQALRNSIIALGLSDNETDKLLIRYGLPTN